MLVPHTAHAQDLPNPAAAAQQTFPNGEIFATLLQGAQGLFAGFLPYIPLIKVMLWGLTFLLAIILFKILMKLRAAESTEANGRRVARLGAEIQEPWSIG
jgi:hypothetical protein